MPLTLATPRPGDERYAEIEVRVEGFSWRAALAGVFISLAIASALHLLGAGIGLTPAGFGLEHAPEAATAGILATIWLTLATVVGFFIGGYVSGYAVPTIAQRDGCVRGAVVWAITVMVVGLIGASTVMRASSAALKGATTVAASTIGTAAGLGAAGAGAVVAQQSQQQGQQPGGMDRLGDMARRATADMSATPTSQMSPEQAGQDLGRLMGKRLRDGSWQGTDKDRAAELLARVNNSSIDEARAKIETTEARIQQEMQEAEQKAKAAAEATAKALAAATYWAFFTVALGLLAAGAGGHMGARRWVEE
jgi:hypothetical protein